MSDTKSSIKIKKFWWSTLAEDGGAGSLWREIQSSTREGTAKFNGSDATKTEHKNILGQVIEEDSVTGAKTVVFQLADLSPEMIAEFMGGVVTDSADYTKYSAPLGGVQVVERSIMFLTARNVLFVIPRVSFSAYPMIDDNDLHYHNMSGTVLLPTKHATPEYEYYVLKTINATDILTFALEEQTGAATINATAHTVAITVATGTPKTALKPTVTASLGASVSPNSGDTTDFTSPVTYVVTAADGTVQNWTVTVTVAP